MNEQEYLAQLADEGSAEIFEHIVRSMTESTEDEFKEELKRMLFGLLMTAFFYGKDPRLFSGTPSKTLSSVLSFAILMEAQTARNPYIKNDTNPAPQQVMVALEDAVQDLYTAISKGDENLIKDKAAEIGSNAMIVANHIKS